MFKTTAKKSLFLEDQRRFDAQVFITFHCLPLHLDLTFCPFQYAEDIESGFSSDVESKYKKIYEDDINPFAAFSRKVLNFFLVIYFVYFGIKSNWDGTNNVFINPSLSEL